jgi:hypothetical protein
MPFDLSSSPSDVKIPMPTGVSSLVIGPQPRQDTSGWSRIKFANQQRFALAAIRSLI